MSSDQNDSAVFDKISACAAGKRLSEGFHGRLVAAVRRRRRRWIAHMLIGTAVAALVCWAAIGLVVQNSRTLPTEERLIATERPHERDSRLTQFAILGFFRECFRRNKNTKRREEEQ